MKTLGSYQLLRKIGHGGMAEVWSARRAAGQGIGDKFVAIKVLARHLAENERYREMFMGEAKLSLVLNHANIVTVFDVVEDANLGECYMVMELIEGMTLSQLARKYRERDQTLPLEVSVYIIAELLRALAYAHGLKSGQGSTIVHRDVSPQNVMVSTSGEVKLMDFGIARFSTEETSGNLVKGKLQYMPPEQLARKTREPTIDLFAVGGILQELVEGKRFRGGIDQELLLGMVIRGESPDLEVELPELINTVRDRLLEPDPDKRLQTAKQALAMLYDWPGYRNASLELEERVCEFVEPASATSMPSGPVEEPSSDASSSINSGAAPPPPSASGDSGEVASDPGSDVRSDLRSDLRSDVRSDLRSGVSQEPELTSEVTSEVNSEELHSEELASDLRPGPASATTGQGEQSQLEDETEIAPPPFQVVDGSDIIPVRPGPNPRNLAIGVGVLLGVLALVLLAFGLWGGEDEEPKQAKQDQEPTVISAKPVPPAESGAAEADTDDTGTETGAEDEQAEGQLVLEDEAGEGGPSKADPPPQDNPATKPRVSVEFVANEFYFVYIKVSGRVVTLEPKTKLKLPVGKHTVYLRQKKTDSWQRAGTINLSKGGSYRVTMTKPAGLKQSKK